MAWVAVGRHDCTLADASVTSLRSFCLRSKKIPISKKSKSRFSKLTKVPNSDFFIDTFDSSMQKKMADTENFQSSLQTVLELRSKSNDAIKTVSEGMTVKHGPENEGKEKKFLSQVKLMMDTVNSQIKDLETKANLTQQNVSSLPLGHSVYLSLDAAPESTSVYNSLFNSYQWFDKTREYSSGATSLLSQNNLSRSYQKNGRTRRRDPNKSHSAAVTSGVATPAK